jgi:hypothetical protein
MTWFDPTKEIAGVDPEKARVQSLLRTTSAIEERQFAWHELGLWNYTLYTNRVINTYRWGADLDVDQELVPTNLRTENLIENIGQAMLSKASSSPIKPTLVPHGNTWRTAKAIRKADRFLFGAWRSAKGENACVEAFNDSYAVGLSCVRVSFEKRGDGNDKCLHADSVFPDCIIIDNEECTDRRTPRTYRIRRAFRREDVEEMYGPQTWSKMDKRYNNKRVQGSGWVIVVEAWRIPDRNGKGGRHCIAVEGVDKFIVDKPWKHQRVPLVFHHWKDRTNGFFTSGGVEQVLPYQANQNELNDDISEAQALACRAKVLSHISNNLDMSQMDNRNGRVINWSGSQPPVWWEAKANLAELYSERERNKAAAYSHVGLSEMFAGADLPSQVRLDSSAAVREQRNLEDSRHLRLWTTFENFRLSVADTMLFVLSIEEDAADYSVKPVGERFSAENVPYKEIKEIIDNQFTWTMEAQSLAMMSPAARRELLRDNTSRGQSEMGGDEAKRMVENPDLEMIEDLELANREDIERHMMLMEEGKPTAPDEFTDLSKGLMLINANMKRLLRFDDVDNNHPVIIAHQDWLLDAAARIKAAKQQQEREQMMEMQRQAMMAPFAPTQGMAGTSAAQPAQ